MQSTLQIITVWVSFLGIVFSLVLRLFNSPHIDIPLLIVIVSCGIPQLLQIFLRLCKGDFGADLLALLSVITAVFLKEYLAASLIILMLASGQTLELYAMRKASSVLLALSKRMPSVAHRKMAEKIEDIALQDIQIGDDIMIYPHEACPVDGVVIAGHGAMDESFLTGEPYQLSKAPGTNVISGALNGESVLTIRAQKLAADSRYASIVAVLTEAEEKRPNIRRLGDQIGAIFTPIALVIALLAWYFTGDAMRFLSVLVIATPCPLLIAIPITIISAISMAARQSIIIKDPTVLEKLPTCRTAIFDKTGTLTYGKPQLIDIIPAASADKNLILQYAASLERYSKHPLAVSILMAAEKSQLPLLEVSQVSEKPGAGLIGAIANHHIQITHRKKIAEQYPEINLQLPPVSAGMECIILLDNKYMGALRFQDVPRQESKSFVGHLIPSHQYKKIMLVSGDRESEVKYLGDILQLTHIYASQTPENKLAIVREETKKGATLFMGDGINDAPALTAATVGIAFGQFSAIAAEAASAVIMDNSLEKVDILMHLSIETRHIALQSAIGGMLLSLVGMGFAAAGYISPVAGAVLQEIIDVLAILNALRLAFVTRDLIH